MRAEDTVPGRQGMASACPQGMATFHPSSRSLLLPWLSRGQSQTQVGSQEEELSCRGPPSLMGLEAPPLHAGSRASGSTQGTQNESTGPSPRAGGALEPGAAQQGKGSSKGFGTSWLWKLLALKERSHSFPCTFGWQRHHGPAHTGKPRAQPGPLSAFSSLFTGPHSSSSTHKEIQGKRESP